MKKFYTLLLIFLIFISCKKESFNNPAEIKKSFTDSALDFLKTKITAAEFNTVNIKSCRVLKYSKNSIGVQVFEKGSDANNFILLKRTAEGFTGDRVKITGIRPAISKEKNGDITLKSLTANTATKFIVEKNKVVQIVTTDDTGSKSIMVNSGGTIVSGRTQSYVLPEVSVGVIVYNIEIDFWSLYWLFNQNSIYNFFYTEASSGNDFYIGGGGSGSDGENDNVVASPNYNPPEHPIANVKDEVKCFTNNNTSTYSISVNVNEPVPGTRGLVNASSNFMVGHTYLTLEQNNSDGSQIIRNLGFYPQNSVKPGADIDVSTFGEDSNTPFAVSLQFSVSASELLTVMNTLIAEQAIPYDMNNFNCTNSAMQALHSININLPSTISNNLLFNGNDPGDLGEDLRGINLDNFSAANGGRKIVRSASGSNSQKAPAKTGGC
jgi:hypothetical protein